MAERRDALLAAAYLIADLKDMAGDHGLDLHTSVGRLEVFPNSPNTVPSEAVLFIELRSGSPRILEEAEATLKARIAAACERAGVESEVRSIDLRPAGAMHPGLVGLAERAGAGRGVRTAISIRSAATMRSASRRFARRSCWPCPAGTG